MLCYAMHKFAILRPPRAAKARMRAVRPDDGVIFCLSAAASDATHRLSTRLSRETFTVRVARFCKAGNPLAVCMPPICDLRPVRPLTAAGSKRHERTTSAQHLHDAHRARAPVLRRTARGPADLWPRRRTACDFIVAMSTLTRSGQLSYGSRPARRACTHARRPRACSE